MKITWKQDTRKYANDELAFAGKWCVAGVHYDGATNGAAKYRISIYLSGIKSQENQISKEAAKAQVEAIIAYWFGEAEK